MQVQKASSGIKISSKSQGAFWYDAQNSQDHHFVDVQEPQAYMGAWKGQDKVENQAATALGRSRF